MEAPRIAIAGGGAAGFFAAISASEANPRAKVTVYEATAHLLAKVRISGGGRCNVTHACFDARELVKRYPRGGRELLGPLHRWGPRETIAWFAARGVELKTETDGRMFPVTDDSATIVSCLQRAAAGAGVTVVTGCGVKAVNLSSDEAMPRFQLTLSDGETSGVDRLLLATGGNRGSAGLAIAAQLGHNVEPPVPSLFTFHIDDPRLRGLEGLSVAHAEATLKDSRLAESGPILITHWGLSGPAVLKLSAWGARELQARDYRSGLRINWAAPHRFETVRAELEKMRTQHPRRQVAGGNPLAIPSRLWERLVAAVGVGEGVLWTGVSNHALQKLSREITEGEFLITGKSMNKEEFVTCGGVRLREVDFRTMESRRCPGLHFAGEILDIDGVTGGFNFQSAWTTGRIAGQAMAGIAVPVG